MRAVQLPLAHERQPAGILSSAEKDIREPKGSLPLKNESSERRPAGTLSSAEKDLRGPKGSLPLKSESCGASAGT